MNPSAAQRAKLAEQRAQQNRQDRLARRRTEQAALDRVARRREQLRASARQEARELRRRSAVRARRGEAAQAEARRDREARTAAARRRAARQAWQLRKVRDERRQIRQPTRLAPRQPLSPRPSGSAPATRARQDTVPPLPPRAASLTGRRPGLADARQHGQQQRGHHPRQRPLNERLAAIRAERRREAYESQRTADLRAAARSDRSRLRKESDNQRLADLRRREQARARLAAQRRRSRLETGPAGTRAGAAGNQLRLPPPGARSATGSGPASDRQPRHADQRSAAADQQRERARERLPDLHLASEDERAREARRRQAAAATRTEQHRSHLANRQKAVDRTARQRQVRRATQRQIHHRMRAADERGIRSRHRERTRRAEVRRGLELARGKQARLRETAAAARTSAWLDDRDLDDLPWLVTEGNRVRDENGNDVYLRGVSAIGLDTAASTDVVSLRDQLGLGDSAIDVLTGLWNATVVRIPFFAGTILTGTSGLMAADLLSGLDDLVTALAQAGAYTLLSLQAPPSPEDVAPLPGDDAVACWQTLTTRYEDTPAVLYEIWSSPKPLTAGWIQAASVLVGQLRLNHPASLLFLGAADGGTSVEGLPLRFSTGQPVHDIVYTVRAPRSAVSPANGQMLRLFARAFPLFVCEWSDTEADLGRAVDAAATLFDQLGMGWAASTWNAEPRLVIDAVANRFTSLPFGRAAQRGLALPVEPQTQPFPLLLPRRAQ